VKVCFNGSADFLSVFILFFSNSPLEKASLPKAAVEESNPDSVFPSVFEVCKGSEAFFSSKVLFLEKTSVCAVPDSSFILSEAFCSSFFFSVVVLGAHCVPVECPLCAQGSPDEGVSSVSRKEGGHLVSAPDCFPVELPANPVDEALDEGDPATPPSPRDPTAPVAAVLF